MPYSGKTPLTGAYQLCDTITTSATASYNLSVGSSPVIPGAAQNCIVSLNGVVQAPVGAYTVSGSTIVFASTLSATDVIDFILILGNVFDIGKPTDGSVTNASVASNAAIAFTKLASTGTITLDNIQFPATAVPSANANNLDDYEEGTWTPIITGGFTGSPTYTSGETKGYYTKIGNMVYVNGTITIATITTAGTNLTYGGLPFTLANTEATGSGFCFIYNRNFASGGTGSLYTTASPNDTTWNITNTVGQAILGNSGSVSIAGNNYSFMGAYRV
jgi:hypothetical protein